MKHGTAETIQGWRQPMCETLCDLIAIPTENPPDSVRSVTLTHEVIRLTPTDPDSWKSPTGRKSA
ncbi:MAG: hypothetical protein PVI11_04435 [Candidatus Aminicenantes bacterium]|jgi:hypothetical protein